MEAWVNQQLHITQSPVHDSLNLRWNNKTMIGDANLVARLFHIPNCVDSSPEGMAFWRNMQMNESVFTILMYDSGNGTVVIEWMNKTKISPEGLSVLGMNYLVKGNGLVEVRGTSFREALALYMVVKDMENRECGVLLLIPFYLQIRGLSVEQLERLCARSNTTHSVPGSALSDNIPKIENSMTSPVAKTIVPVSAFYELTSSRHISSATSGTLPTLLGCHPFAKVVNAPPNRSLAMIHTPDTIGQPVLYS